MEVKIMKLDIINNLSFAGVLIFTMLMNIVIWVDGSVWLLVTFMSLSVVSSLTVIVTGIMLFRRLIKDRKKVK